MTGERVVLSGSFDEGNSRQNRLGVARPLVPDDFCGDRRGSWRERQIPTPAPIGGSPIPIGDSGLAKGQAGK